MTTNPNAPRGFQPQREGTGQPFNGSGSPYLINSGFASAIGTFDVVKLTTSGYLAPANAGARALPALAPDPAQPAAAILHTALIRKVCHTQGTEILSPSPKKLGLFLGSHSSLSDSYRLRLRPH